MPRLYLAGPLFTQGEWMWNSSICAGLRALKHEVVLPQERAATMLSGAEKFDADALFSANVTGIEHVAVVVAILEGADCDSGTSWECGYAYKLGLPVIGVRSDLRGGGDDPGARINLMLSKCCRRIITVEPGRRTDVDWVVKQIDAAIQEVTGKVPGRQ
jgi:nucleoside 2-deoxyribosyltransferase